MQPPGLLTVSRKTVIYQYRDHLGNARVSFAKNSEGLLEVTDTNNYYPFGLNHIQGIFEGANLGSYYSYKYNGKELQETGMYDYGARFYMPDLGRWGVIDPLAETSRRWSPYTYAYNNPMRFIDPDGMQNKDITIPSGTDQKGIDAIMANLQKLTRDKLTTVEGVNGKIHVLIEKFEKNGRYETGNQLIRDLITDEHNVNIRIGEKGSAKAKNSESASNGVGTDSDITFNPTGKQDIRVFGENGKTMYETSPNFIILGHELIHAKDHFDGTLNKTESEHGYLDLKGIRLIETHSKSEFRASGFPGFVGKDGYSENKIRKEQGLKLRASYETFRGRTR
ncbi:M91 family zinc metallopeptidase [Chryseobacterium kwangjuense]|uniref:RHS repeat-associated core domain-containing protein n=1 Tax=Chryseobacterium kwangjuense TaxID=267125 RepID=A0A135W961_9FLAO|nr:M91 family zinc metallopeptidase [Chryseobacterium kwangjuense]KXH81441.1 hypothetical protein AU378_17210 [Chryseobacterium kwangjuense]